MNNDTPPESDHFSLRRRQWLLSSAFGGWAASLNACGGAGDASLAQQAPSIPTQEHTPIGDINSVITKPAPTEPLPTPPAPSKPAWADSIEVDTWSSLRGTAFAPWAKANIPAGAYYGNEPFNSIVNAYCDPANDPLLGAQYFFGGGHDDGSCNAVIKFDHQNLSWSLLGQPTPPSVYLPGFPRAKTYPSGRLFDGWFLPVGELPDARDHVYAAPALARASTHMYSAAVKRGTRLHYFYGHYGEFDTATGQWLGRGVDLGAQLTKFRPQYGTAPLQQGTVAMYDEVTDRMFVTLTPGDAGGSWRSAIMVFNPKTRGIESVIESNASTFGFVSESLNMCRVGRDLFCFNKIGAYGQPSLMNQGFIFNMDSLSFKRFVLTGDTQGSTFAFSNTQETIPSFYDGRAIRRWNYQSADRSKIYSVDPRPVSGSGSTTEPLVFVQTVRNIGGAVIGQPKFMYTRFVYHGGAGCALMIPEATSDWVALRLS